MREEEAASLLCAFGDCERDSAKPLDAVEEGKRVRTDEQRVQGVAGDGPAYAWPGRGVYGLDDHLMPSRQRVHDRPSAEDDHADERAIG